MFGRNVAEAPVRERGDLVSRMLLREGDALGVGLEVTWGDGAPGSRHRSHDHDAEQVYAVLGGRGRVRVGDEREVGRGGLVYIPSGAAHGIEDESGEPLAYVSAATPAMDALAACGTGRLRAEAAESEEGA